MGQNKNCCIDNREIVLKAGSINKARRMIWVKEVVEQIPAGSRILDAGAGELLYKQFCDHLEYVSQDVAEYDGQGDSVGMHSGEWDVSKVDVISDITDIPEPDASFDAVMCIEVLEHLSNPVLVFKEFNRLLRPDGYLIITAPFCSLTHQAPYHFCTGFNQYFYQRHLSENGFKITEIEPNGNYFDFLMQEIRRVPRVASRYAGYKVSIWDRYVIKFILGTLQRLSRKGQQSSELLCFGYHVLARKHE